MSLTAGQMATLAASIAADPVLGLLSHTPDNAVTIANVYNQPATPAFWVWRSSVSNDEIYSTTTSDGTTWSWTSYINRSQGERDAWNEIFHNRFVNFELANVVQAMGDIFSGAGLAPAQRTHIFTVASRQATRFEKLFTTGTGTKATPGLMGVEGPLQYNDIVLSWSS
jgi:hypothetical protein